MVDFRITWTFSMASQPPKSPLSGDFEKDRVIDKCRPISTIHHSYLASTKGLNFSSVFEPIPLTFWRASTLAKSPCRVR